MLTKLEFEHSWGGFVCMTRNRTTAFAQLASNVYTSTAYNGSAICKSSIFGKLLADKTAGATSEEWSKAESIVVPLATKRGLSEDA